MLIEDVSIRIASLVDARVLGVVGPAAYAESYGYLWEDASAYAEQLNTFSASAFEILIGAPDAYVWIAEIGGRPVGFLTMIVGSCDPVGEESGGAEIARIYLLGPGRGRGIGRMLLDQAEQLAGTQGCGYLWLDAMASAEWACRTYERWRFTRIGEAAFGKPIKAGLDRMVVLKRRIAER